MLYGDNRNEMLLFVAASCTRLWQITHNARLERLHASLVQESGKWPIDKLRSLFILLLNVDPVLKNFVCQSDDRKLLADCVQVAEGQVGSSDVYDMCQSARASPEKLRRFFELLSNKLVPEFLMDTQKSFNEFERKCRSEYVAS